jgi:hypothetical protein
VTPTSTPRRGGILADGALQVDYLTVPADWSSGEVITGEMLWPGAAVDADGNPTDWPGWNQLPDGTWFLDPSDPFYVLRSTSIVEFRINPTVATGRGIPAADRVLRHEPSRHADTCSANRRTGLR